MEDGMVISNAPSKLSPKAMNSSGDETVHPRVGAQLLDSDRPQQRRDRKSQARKENDDPQAKNHRLRDPAALSPGCRLRKYDMVMGIMGKTQGVKMQASPAPKATSRKAGQPCASDDGGTGRSARARRFGLRETCGNRGRWRPAAGSTVNGTVTLQFAGDARLVVAGLVAAVDGQFIRRRPGASLRTFTSSRNVASPW